MNEWNCNEVVVKTVAEWKKNNIIINQRVWTKVEFQCEHAWYRHWLKKWREKWIGNVLFSC